MPYNEKIDPERLLNSKSLAQQTMPREAALLMNIAQFWNPQNHPEPYSSRPEEPRRPIRHLLEISNALLAGLNYEQSELIYELLKAGNRTAVIQIIAHPELLEERQDLLIKTMAVKVNLRRAVDSEWLKRSSDLPVSEIIKEADKLSCDHAEWMARWKNELENLNLNDNS